MEFNPADLDLTECEKQLEEAKARLEAVQAFRQNANDLEWESRIDEIRAVLGERDGTMREQQEARIRLRDQLAELNKKQAAMKEMKKDLERRGRERQMQYQLDEIALKMADSEKLVEQQTELAELIRTKETHIQACDDIIDRNVTHASTQMADLIHQTTLLDEALASNIIHTHAPIKSLADDVHAHLRLERKKYVIAQNKRIMHLQHERFELETQLSACTARRNEADFVFTKGPDFLIALHEGAVPPMKYVQANAPSSEDAPAGGSGPRGVVPMGDMDVVVKDAEHMLQSGHTRMLELRSCLDDLEREVERVVPPRGALADNDGGKEIAPWVVKWIRGIVDHMGSSAVMLAFEKGGRPKNEVEEQQGMYANAAPTSAQQFLVAHDACYTTIPLVDEIMSEVCGEMAHIVAAEVLRYGDEVKGMLRHVFALTSMRRSAARRKIAAEQAAMATKKGRKAAKKAKLSEPQEDDGLPKIALKENEETTVGELNSAFRQMFDDARQLRRRTEERGAEHVTDGAEEQVADDDVNGVGDEEKT